LDIGNKLKKHIFLTGFMGSGKSTIGKNLATQLQVKFVDTDDRIEAQYNIEIKEIFQEQGESRFREYEESMLDEIIEKEKPAIISLGNRIKHSTRRPLLRKDGEEWTKKMYLARIAELMKEREQGYEQAHLILDRDGKEVEEIIEELLKKI
jgi:shikimate kinase